jgi:predicted O-methyltransferase YrrM
MNNYIFDGRDIGNLVYSVIDLGSDITVAEIGAYKAQSSCMLLQKCPNIKKMYLIDPYISHIDILFNETVFDEKDMEFAKLTAHHNVRYSGCVEKAQFLEMNEQVASNFLEDESLDMLFIDSWPNPESIYDQLERWYKKVKPGGLFSGHDWHHELIRNTVIKFNKDNTDIFVNNVNNTWMWKK